MGIPPAPLPPGARGAAPAPDWRDQLLQDPLSLSARYGMAQACLAQGDTAGAVAWLSDACRMAPDDPEAAGRLAELLRMQGATGQALGVWRRLHAAGARDRATLLGLGQALEQAGELAAAIDLYRDAATREPGLVEAHVRLAQVACRARLMPLALAHAQAAVNLAPEDPAAIGSLAEVRAAWRDAGEDLPPLDALALPEVARARVCEAAGWPVDSASG